jgi:adenosylhomocysteine nucleosidase
VRTLLVLTAIDLEARALARQLGIAPVAGADFPHFRTGGVEIACVGLRASALAARAARFTRADVVVSAGACGALAPELALGALVVPEAVVTEDGARLPAAPLPGLDARGTLVTVARVVTSAADKSRLWIDTGAVACDMESAAIVAWAAAQGFAAAVVRGVSDTAEHGVPADLAASVGDDGRVRTVSAVRAALSRRGALRDALALRRGTNAALAAVASALARVTRARIAR